MIIGKLDGEESRMPFLPGDTMDSDEEISNSLVGLVGRFRDGFSQEDLINLPKVMGRAAAAYQCLYRRTVESAFGLRSAWEADNLITAVTMARSLIETGAIAWRLSDLIGKSLEKKDATELYNVVMKISFANRVNLIPDKVKEYEATSIMSAIDGMDKWLFRKKKPGNFRHVYDVLSEIVHPNYWGMVGLYGIFVDDGSRIEFGNKKRKDDLLPIIAPALVIISFVNLLGEQFQGTTLRQIGELVAP